MEKIGETTVAKGNRNGWSAHTSFLIGIIKDDKPGALYRGQEGKRILRISTRKANNGGIYTSANVEVLWPDGCTSHLLFGDFSKTIIRSQSKCSEKAVRQLHADALKLVDSVGAEAEAFYKEKEEKRREEATLPDTKHTPYTDDPRRFGETSPAT